MLLPSYLLLVWCILAPCCCMTSQSGLQHFENPPLIQKPNPCFGLCDCGMKNYTTFPHQVYMVNCSDTNLRDTTILQYMPLEIEVLIFTGNNITFLPSNIFGNVSLYKKLKVIDMSSNQIKIIHGKTFHHVDSVERLILNHNDLSVSREAYHPRIFSNFRNLKELHLTNAFADDTPENLAENLHDIFTGSELDQLEKLHLEQNEISIFKDPKLFCDLPSLIHLYLGDNYLRGVHFDLLCMEKLEYLDLERNKIAVLTKEDLTMLDLVRNRTVYFTVEVANNPFRCKCDVSYFYTWLTHTKVSIRHNNTIKCDLTLLHCFIQTGNGSILGSKSAEKSSNASSFMMFIVSLLVLALVILIYVKRDSFKSCSKPTLDTVSRKVQYTSLSRTTNNLEIDL